MPRLKRHGHEGGGPAEDRCRHVVSEAAGGDPYPGREDLTDGEKHGDGEHALARAMDARPEEAPMTPCPASAKPGMTRTMRTTGPMIMARRRPIRSARGLNRRTSATTMTLANRLAALAAVADRSRFALRKVGSSSGAWRRSPSCP